MNTTPWKPKVEEGKSLEDLPINEWVSQAIDDAAAAGDLNDAARADITKSLVVRINTMVIDAIEGTITTMEGDLSRKLVSWEIGIGDINGTKLPVLRTHVVTSEMSVRNTTHIIDLMFPNDDAVRMLRGTLKEYLAKSKEDIAAITKKQAANQRVQWWKNGDHPQDNVGEEVSDPLAGGTYRREEGAVVRYFRNPDYPSHGVHLKCGKIWHEHGWIDSGGNGVRVCPGDYIYRDKVEYGL